MHTDVQIYFLSILTFSDNLSYSQNAENTQRKKNQVSRNPGQATQGPQVSVEGTRPLPSLQVSSLRGGLLGRLKVEALVNVCLKMIILFVLQ